MINFDDLGATLILNPHHVRILRAQSLVHIIRCSCRRLRDPPATFDIIIILQSLHRLQRLVLGIDGRLNAFRWQLHLRPVSGRIRRLLSDQAHVDVEAAMERVDEM